MHSSNSMFTANSMNGNGNDDNTDYDDSYVEIVPLKNYQKYKYVYDDYLTNCASNSYSSDSASTEDYFEDGSLSFSLFEDNSTTCSTFISSYTSYAYD